MSNVVVVGAGVIGLSIAWQAAQAGAVVSLCDPDPGRGASWAAAGMLAPVTEAHYGEEDLLGLNLASAHMWGGFAAELEAATGQSVGYRATGTLVVALDADDAAALDELARFLDELDLGAQRLDVGQLRAREPALHPRIRAGLHATGDHQVDSRRLVTALREACRTAGVCLVDRAVDHVEVRSGRATGVGLDDGRPLVADHVVVAAGCWSNLMGGVPDEACPPVRPVKGQVLRLRDHGDVPLLTRTVRGLARGRHVYVVPRVDGEVVVGATSEELGFDTTVTAGAVHDLLRAATDLVPGLAELELVEARAGLRPGSPDNAPIIGTTPVEGLLLATGHHRHGVLLAPVTAAAITALLTSQAPPLQLDAFGLGRFA